MATFKAGDRVRVVNTAVRDDAPVGSEGVLQSNYEGGINRWNVTWDDGRKYPYVNSSDIELAQPRTKKDTNFILQYELDADPFETFATMKEVEARIKELAKRTDLKRESIKVYEIAKTYDVSLETRIIFGPRVVMTEQPEKKRGRPKKADLTLRQKKAAYMRKWYKKNKAKRTNHEEIPG